MVRLFFLFILNVFFVFSALAQKENNIWYFGEKAGLDFNGVNPLGLIDGELNTLEGCASVSDFMGNLLFYTDGVKIWNRLHAVMPNGDSLMGNYNSTQSAFIVKKPKADSVYYVFTTDQYGKMYGLRYSEVDMTLNGGLGAVTMNKNIPIHTPVCEKVTAIKHDNGNDYWIVSHHFGNNTFYCYLLNSTGINLNPVVSNVGSAIIDSINTKGYLKGSLDGKRIAAANANIGLEVFNFDNATGLISPTVIINKFLTEENVYGLEFSPNSRFLYVSYNLSPGRIVQLDLLAGSMNEIKNSSILLDSLGNGGALQLGPDKKIYCSKLNAAYVGVIKYPNEQGVSCGYVENEVFLEGRVSRFGLPPLLPYENFFLVNNTCLGDITKFSLNSLYSVDSVKWNFGDPASGILNFSTMENPFHKYNSLGSYEVYLDIYKKGIKETLMQVIHIYPYPPLFIGNDTLLCPGDVIILDATTPNGLYYWHNYGFNTPTLNVTTEGLYGVDIEVNGCRKSDLILIKYIYQPFDLGENVLFCYNEPLLLDVNAQGASHTWQDGNRNPSYLVTEKGKYWVTVKLDGCVNSDTIFIDYNSIPTKNFSNDTTICEGEEILLKIKQDNFNFLWQDNSTAGSFLLSEAGYYSVEISDDDCYYSYEINVEVEQCELEMPNVFTPNNDGINDRFVPFEILLKTKGELFIFNRFGLKVFETENLVSGWGGMCNGRPCNEGTYFWVVKFQTQTYGELTTKGFVTLLK
ncbi:MAG: gliding motility-associated C-terminal domain-containing protein [Bacteroidetes bacterium]|nr:gliding motility-associated C-terminal domain-containing protein [Bacteroidota bacterium]HET6244063.1 gliding motility-associated C-terminal domain-containing protein [Bacteroidia bacterium]